MIVVGGCTGSMQRDARRLLDEVIAEQPTDHMVLTSMAEVHKVLLFTPFLHGSMCLLVSSLRWCGSPS